MGKKILIGCLVFAVIAAIAGSIGMYYFVVKPAKSMVESAVAVADVSDLNKNIQNQDEFIPPENGELTADQVDRFVRVQRRLQADVEAQMEELGDEAKKYKRQLENNQVGLGALTEIWRELGGVYREVKQTQVEALNQEGFSLDEYRWVKGQFFKALGTDALSVGLDQIAEAIEKKNPDLLDQEDLDSLVPEKNRELARPYADESKKWISYAWLGL